MKVQIEKRKNHFGQKNIKVKMEYRKSKLNFKKLEIMVKKESFEQINELLSIK